MQRGGRVPGSSPNSSIPSSPGVSATPGGFDMEMQQQQPIPGSPGQTNQAPPNKAQPQREPLRSVPLVVASYNIRVECVWPFFEELYSSRESESLRRLGLQTALSRPGFRWLTRVSFRVCCVVRVVRVVCVLPLAFGLALLTCFRAATPRIGAPSMSGPCAAASSPRPSSRWAPT